MKFIIMWFNVGNLISVFNTVFTNGDFIWIHFWRGFLNLSCNLFIGFFPVNSSPCFKSLKEQCKSSREKKLLGKITQKDFTIEKLRVRQTRNDV